MRTGRKARAFGAAGLFTVLMAIAASAQNGGGGGTGEDEAGRWVPRGTFALSLFDPNPVRGERSFAGAGREASRIVTFLSGMTIVYRSRPSPTRGDEGYVVGVTHSGIPVHVLEEELSSSDFSDRSTQDVVIHRAHEGCRNAECTGDPFIVGIGESFTIVEEDAIRIRLLDTDEKEVVYTPTRFKELEKDGFLTRHKDRVHPRWTIHDGYAARLSTGCGEARTQAEPLTVTIEDYASDPATWEINDDRWSLKAIEIFDLGFVRSDAASGEITGRLASPIKGQDDETVAIDLTVFSYRDSEWRAGFRKFAGILQIVQCERGNRLGRVRPRYVKEAIVYFDRREGDDYEQVFPLDEFEMPRQFDEETQDELSTFIPRSFFYSVNTSQQYEMLFEAVSDFIPFPTAVANIIARLNASCSQTDRPRCRELSEPAFD